jgi:hypothetical protein
MSGQLINQKAIASIAAGIAYHREYLKNNDSIKGMGEYNVQLKSFLNNSGVNLEQSPGKIAYDVYRSLSESNHISANTSIYNDHEELEPLAFEFSPEAFEDPKSNGLGVPLTTEGLYYLTSNTEFLHGHIGEPFRKTDLVKSLERLSENMHNVIVHSMKGYREQSFDMDLIAQSVQSGKANGSQRYNMEGGFRIYSDRFYTEIRDFDNNDHSLVYGDDLLMHMINQIGNSTMEVPKEFDFANKTIPHATSYSTAKYQLQGDIPDFTETDVIRIGHALDKLNISVQGREASQFVGFDGKSYTESEADELKRKVQSMVLSHSRGITDKHRPRTEGFGYQQFVDKELVENTPSKKFYVVVPIGTVSSESITIQSNAVPGNSKDVFVDEMDAKSLALREGMDTVEMIIPPKMEWVHRRKNIVHANVFERDANIVGNELDDFSYHNIPAEQLSKMYIDRLSPNYPSLRKEADLVNDIAERQGGWWAPSKALFTISQSVDMAKLNAPGREVAMLSGLLDNVKQITREVEINDKVSLPINGAYVDFGVVYSPDEKEKVEALIHLDNGMIIDEPWVSELSMKVKNELEKESTTPEELYVPPSLRRS